MELIKKLREIIDDEIEDVEKYAKMAAEYKKEYSSLAQVLNTIYLHKRSIEELAEARRYQDIYKNT